MSFISDVDQRNLFDAEGREVLYFENMDLDHVVSPVKVDEFERLLVEACYDDQKMKFLIDGFRNGFSIGYEGDQQVKRKAPNLKLEVGNKTELWNKVMKEVELGRYSGPYKKDELPFNSLMQSPIGLVPKAGERPD